MNSIEKILETISFAKINNLKLKEIYLTELELIDLFWRLEAENLVYINSKDPVRDFISRFDNEVCYMYGYRVRKI